MEEGGFCRGKGLTNISENLDDGGGGESSLRANSRGESGGRKGRRSPRACLRARGGERGGIRKYGAMEIQYCAVQVFPACLRYHSETCKIGIQFFPL